MYTMMFIAYTVYFGAFKYTYMYMYVYM